MYYGVYIGRSDFDEIINSLLISYILIFVTTIILFLVNRKTPKDENKNKKELIIFIILIIIAILSVILPHIYNNIILEKFFKTPLSQDKEILKTDYIFAINEETGICEILDENGEMQASLDVDKINDISATNVIQNGKNKGILKYVVAKKDDKTLIFNINNIKNIECILEFKSIFDIGNRITSSTIENAIGDGGDAYENDIESNELGQEFLLKIDSKEEFKKFETEENTAYKYFENKKFNILLQVSKRQIDITSEEIADEKEEYWLIKRRR